MNHRVERDPNTSNLVLRRGLGLVGFEAIYAGFESGHVGFDGVNSPDQAVRMTVASATWFP